MQLKISMDLAWRWIREGNTSYLYATKIYCATVLLLFTGGVTYESVKVRNSPSLVTVVH